MTTIDWKNHARLEQKVLYITHTIGNCYQLQALYNESQKLVTMQINILAFPTQGATFALGPRRPADSDDIQLLDKNVEAPMSLGSRKRGRAEWTFLRIISDVAAG